MTNPSMSFVHHIWTWLRVMAADCCCARQGMDGVAASQTNLLLFFALQDSRTSAFLLPKEHEQKIKLKKLFFPFIIIIIHIIFWENVLFFTSFSPFSHISDHLLCTILHMSGTSGPRLHPNLTNHATHFGHGRKSGSQSLLAAAIVTGKHGGAHDRSSETVGSAVSQTVFLHIFFFIYMFTLKNYRLNCWNRGPDVALVLRF